MPTIASVDRLHAHFRRSSHPHLADYVADVRDGAVILDGVAPSYYAKQLVQTIAGRCQGVDRVINNVRVAQPTAQA